MSVTRYNENIRQQVERVLSEDTRNVATLELHQHMRLGGFNEHTMVDLIVAAYMVGIEKSASAKLAPRPVYLVLQYDCRAEETVIRSAHSTPEAAEIAVKKEIARIDALPQGLFSADVGYPYVDEVVVDSETAAA